MLFILEFSIFLCYHWKDNSTEMNAKKCCLNTYASNSKNSVLTNQKAIFRETWW